MDNKDYDKWYNEWLQYAISYIDALEFAIWKDNSIKICNYLERTKIKI